MTTKKTTKKTTKGIPVLIVNRGDFMAWTEGSLLERDAKGVCLVSDNIDHEKVEQLLDAGETVGLSVNGRLFSTLSLEERGYVEKLV